MASRLRKLKIDKVDRCEYPANSGARIILYKSAGAVREGVARYRPAPSVTTTLRETLDTAMAALVGQTVAKSAGMTRADAIRKTLADPVAEDAYRLTSYGEASLPLDLALDALYTRFAGNDDAVASLRKVERWLQP